MKTPDWTDLNEAEQKMFTNVIGSFSEHFDEDITRMFAIEAYTLAVKLIGRHARETGAK